MENGESTSNPRERTQIGRRPDRHRDLFLRRSGAGGHWQASEWDGGWSFPALTPPGDSKQSWRLAKLLVENIAIQVAFGILSLIRWKPVSRKKRCGRKRGPTKVIRYYFSVVRASKRSLVQVVQAVRHRRRSNDIWMKNTVGMLLASVYLRTTVSWSIWGARNTTHRHCQTSQMNDDRFVPCDFMISDPRISLAWVRIINMRPRSIGSNAFPQAPRTKYEQLTL